MFEENEISKNANGGTEIAKRSLSKLIDPELLSNFQIISSRPRDLQSEKIRVLFAHDLPEDPESAKFRDSNWRNKFHKFVFISNWQYQRYQLIHGLHANPQSVVLETGIYPAPESCLEKPKDKIRLVYTSTPQRGLDILVSVFEQISKDNPDIHLDVFSSFKIYGWEDADQQFEPLYDRIRNHPQMTYHGFQPHETVLEHLNKAHIFAYPSTWIETSCRALIEAMSAGLVCVHNNMGALPETSGGLNVMYHADMDDKNHHAVGFANHLLPAINMVRDNKEKGMINFNKAYVDARYNINLIANKWDIMLKDLMWRYPNVESRGIPSEMFVYRTI
jgi:UDP-glucose:(glucosyl)LPS alpha-1,2-glucosyltransferase